LGGFGVFLYAEYESVPTPTILFGELHLWYLWKNAEMCNNCQRYDL